MEHEIRSTTVEIQFELETKDIDVKNSIYNSRNSIRVGNKTVQAVVYLSTTVEIQFELEIRHKFTYLKSTTVEIQFELEMEF